MAVIELVDRDIQAKKIDTKKEPEVKAKPTLETKSKNIDKKTKSKK